MFYCIIDPDTDITLSNFKMSINTHTQRAQKQYLFIASTQLLDTYKRFFFPHQSKNFL